MTARKYFERNPQKFREFEDEVASDVILFAQRIRANGNEADAKALEDWVANYPYISSQEKRFNYLGL